MRRRTKQGVTHGQGFGAAVPPAAHGPRPTAHGARVAPCVSDCAGLRPAASWLLDRRAGPLKPHQETLPLGTRFL